jgi:hypothetical protein
MNKKNACTEILGASRTPSGILDAGRLFEGSGAAGLARQGKGAGVKADEVAQRPGGAHECGECVGGFLAALR